MGLQGVCCCLDCTAQCLFGLVLSTGCGLLQSAHCGHMLPAVMSYREPGGFCAGGFCARNRVAKSRDGAAASFFIKQCCACLKVRHLCSMPWAHLLLCMKVAVHLGSCSHTTATKVPVAACHNASTCGQLGTFWGQLGTFSAVCRLSPAAVCIRCAAFLSTHENGRTGQRDLCQRATIGSY